MPPSEPHDGPTQAQAAPLALIAFVSVETWCQIHDFDSDGGVIFHGSKGVLICGCYGRSPRLYPASLRAEAVKIPHTIERIPAGMEGHEMDWVRACKGGPPASSNFDYSGPLSEMVLMGNLAVRFPNQQLLWDGEQMQVKNHKDANAYVRRKYREGWTL